MRVLITGASGLIGGHLLERFRARGDEALALTRDPSTIAPPGATFRMPDQIPESVFPGADVLIHCAYSSENSTSAPIDLSAARRLFALARAHQVRIVFLSSLSALGRAESEYAENKRRIEALLEPEDLVFRPGLVLARTGGLFGRLCALIERRRIIPLIDGGRDRLQTIPLLDLGQAIVRAVHEGRAGRYALAHPDPITLRMLLERCAQLLGRKPNFIYVPSGALAAGLSLTEALGLRLPIRRDNVIGLRGGRIIDTRSDLEQLGVQLEAPLESLGRLLTAPPT